MGKIIFSIFVLFLLLLLISLSLASVQVLATTVSGEMIKGIGPLPPCPPNVTGRLDYTETDKKGNKLEVWCNEGQYQMKFTPSGGSPGVVGKCPFPWGQNAAAKKINGTVLANGTVITEEILRTVWISHDAPAPGPGVTGTNRSDKAWVYDSRLKKYIRQNTLHDGAWVLVNGSWVYNVTDRRNDGVPTPPADPPANASDLACGIEPCPPAETYVIHATYTPEYALYSPVPITSIDEYGVIETNVYKIPYGGELVVERVEAVENQFFSFDVNMPGEDIEGLVHYFLVSAPVGMWIDPSNGIINWLPTPMQVGYHNVTVIIQYPGLSPDIDEFTLPVLSDMDSDGIADRRDNCPREFNPLQEDFDGDTYGDVCDLCTKYEDANWWLVNSYLFYNFNWYFNPDYCSDSMTLVDYYCPNNKLSIRKLACFKLGFGKPGSGPGGYQKWSCMQGACVPM